MSGGVDSSVAALLLQEAGHEVVGVFMRNGVASGAAPAAGAGASRSCCSASDARDASAVADRLGVPFYAVDYAVEFDRIVEHFAAEYRAGRTPNPCVLCNSDLKFGHLMRLADGIGAEFVATGHYARVVDGELRTARDAHKDQTYYLFGIERAALARARFPLGELHKDEVRACARRAGLPTADKRESMEICFVTSGDYRDVVRARGGAGRAGRFVDEHGADLGAHGGVGLFTVGQRRGLPALGAPYYVREIRAASGEVVLCRREGLGVGTAVAAGVNWLVDPPGAPGVQCGVKVRARARPAAAWVGQDRAGRVRIEFEEPVEAVTPGQAAVFYRDTTVLGGATILASTAGEDPLQAL